MISETRKILLSAGAAAALAFAVGAAQAEEPRACAEPACQSELPFADAATTGGAESAVSLASPKYGTWGFDLSGMDRSVKPGDDFFKFANGKWDERTQIPADRTRYGNFNKLRELSEHRMHAILEDAAAGKLTDPDAAKIAAGYAAFMDEALADKLDARPIAPELAQIRKVKSRDDFTVLMAKANTSGFTSILPVFISIDAKAPTKYAVMSGTGGLGLPDRDYYLQPGFAEKKAKYQAYVR
jgi:putative endopeptidase